LRARLAVLTCSRWPAAVAATRPRRRPRQTPNPTTAAEPTATAEPGSAGNAFIGSLAVEPADGTLVIGTGLGLFRAEKGARKARRVVGELTTADATGPVSSNLVVRYVGRATCWAPGIPRALARACRRTSG